MTARDKLRSGIRGISTEVAQILSLTTRPWTGRLLPLPDTMWNTHKQEIYELPDDVQTKLIEFYSEVQQTNAIVELDLRKIAWGGGYIDNNYREQSNIVSQKAKGLVDMLGFWLNGGSIRGQNQLNPERRYTEGITAMTAGLAFVILGGTVLGLPQWSAAIFIPAGILAYYIGLRWYRSSLRP